MDADFRINCDGKPIHLIDHVQDEGPFQDFQNDLKNANMDSNSRLQSQISVNLTTDPLKINKKKKKRLSFLVDIVRRIRRNSSLQPTVSVYPTSQISVSANVEAKESTNLKECPENSAAAVTDSAREEQESNRRMAYSAQEILSPRQLISSTTNMCSIRKDEQRTGETESKDKITDCTVKEKTSLPVNKSFNSTPSFDEVLAKLEETLLRYRFETDVDCKLFTNMIVKQLKQHSTKLSFNDQIIAEMVKREEEKEDSNIVGESSERELSSVKPSTREKVPHLKLDQRDKSQNLLELHTVNARSHVTEAMYGSAASSASNICKNCKCARQKENSSFRNEEFVQNTMKENDVDSCSRKTFYEREFLDHSRYFGSEAGTSSRSLKSTTWFDGNLEGFVGRDSPTRQCSNREHSPPERDLSARLSFEANTSRCSFMSPSFRGVDHVYHDQDIEQCLYPHANLACCGLVMYGQNGSTLSLAQGQYCHRTIPVCGTVSQGISPRYEPNLLQSTPYQERDPCSLQRNRHRKKSKCDCCNRLQSTERVNRRHQHHICKAERKSEPETNRENRTDAGISPPPVLRNFAKAANTVLATIFRRSTNREPHLQAQSSVHLVGLDGVAVFPHDELSIRFTKVSSSDQTRGE
ncbi:uncharacterized protein [Neodiprion pinetum]|uniref:uncharacterized protein n=1 Tax=Neodiprion pinetum TaxID=441929 RepID=UPI001EDFBEAC|nr:uncharacterized protein LOC124211317 [Neodiprion pinetum]